MKLKLLVAAVAFAAAGMANAATIITFAQSGASNSVTGSTLGTNQNTFSTIDSLVTLGGGYIGSGYMSFNFLSDAGTFTKFGANYYEALSGSFSVYNNLSHSSLILGGTFTSNVGVLQYSAGTFTITAGTAGYAATDLVFTSSVFAPATLDLERAMTFSFTNVIGLVAPQETDTQFSSFTSNESGNTSADPFVPPPQAPEPATALLAGLGLLGLAASRRTAKKA